MRATPHKPLLDLAQARRQHATRPAAGKQRASPTRPDPTRPSPSPAPRSAFAFLRSSPIRSSSIPADPRLLHPRPPLPPRPQSSQASAPEPPRRIDQDQRAGPRDTDLGRGHGGSQSMPSGLFRRMSAGWSPLAVPAGRKQPFQKQPTPTKQKGPICRRYGHTRSRAKIWPGTLFESRVRPPLATIGGAKTRCDKE